MPGVHTILAKKQIGSFIHSDKSPFSKEITLSLNIPCREIRNSLYTTIFSQKKKKKKILMRINLQKPPPKASICIILDVYNVKNVVEKIPALVNKNNVALVEDTTRVHIAIIQCYPTSHFLMSLNQPIITFHQNTFYLSFQILLYLYIRLFAY